MTILHIHFPSSEIPVEDRIAENACSKLATHTYKHEYLVYGLLFTIAKYALCTQFFFCKMKRKNGQQKQQDTNDQLLRFTVVV